MSYADTYGEKKGKDTRPWKERFEDYFVNDGPKFVLMVFWVLGCIAAFGERYNVYCITPILDANKDSQDADIIKLKAVYAILGQGVCIARGSAAVIKLNAALLMIAVLRNFLSWLRGTFVGTYLPIDKNIIFHRYLAWSIMFFGIAHTMAHFFNFYNLATHETLENLEIMGFAENPKVANLAFTTLPGSTGHIVCLIMILMYSSALKYVRGPLFNVFWFTHHLFIPFFGLLMIHGAGGLLEPPTFYMWTIGPLLLYFFERGLRICRGNTDTILQLAVVHPSEVLELQMKKAAFSYKSGQFLFLNCPYISKQEWHPFTISSAPEDDHVSVHIKKVGDWTGDLMAFLNPNNELGIVQEQLLAAPDGSPMFRIDGPYGAAAEEVFDAKIAVLCAAGIGVTPFASVLKSIRAAVNAGRAMNLQKVYFFWICREANSFEWFGEVITELEKAGCGDGFLEFHIYLTANMKVEQIQNIVAGTADGTDAITGLQAQTNYGRPNWVQIFDDLAEKYIGEEVCIFVCGPRVLSKTLYKECKRVTSTRTNTKFKFNKENF